MLSSLLNIFKSGSNDKPKPTQSNVPPVTPRNVSPAEEAVNHADRLGNCNKSAAVTSPKQPEPIVFDGNVASFPTFWKRFRVVHKSAVSDTRKLISLKAYLGSPKLLDDIDGQNYTDAVKTLFSKYQYDPDAEYGRLFDELLKIKLDNDTVSAAREAVAKMESILIKMEDLGEDMEDPALRTAYICRLPKRYQTTFEGTFAEVRKHVAALVEADARKQTVVNSVKPMIVTSAKTADIHSQNPTNPSQSAYEPDGVCVFCQKHPYSNDCTVIPSCNRRLKYLESVNRCHRCLGLGHESTNCRNSVNCQFCARRSHHMAVCWQNPRFPKNPPKAVKPGQKIASKPPSSTESTKEITTPLKSPVLTALYDQLQQLTLTEQRLMPSYDVYTKMEQILAQMAAVNEDMECTELRKLYLDRLPRWMHQKFSKTDSLEQIRNAVKKEYDVCMENREREIQTHRKPKVADSDEKTDDAVKPPKLINGHPFPEPSGACLFCGKHRYSYDCTIVITFDERMKIIAAKSKCHRCLGDHKQEDCRDVMKCCFCQKRSHHVAVCRLNPKLGKKKIPVATVSATPAIPATSASTVTPNEPKATPIADVCVFCSGKHASADCNVVLNYETRMTIVTGKGLCYNCLGNHFASDCDSPKCRLCHRSHHESLCWNGLCIFCEGKHSASNCTVVRDYEKRISCVTGKGLCFICLQTHRASNCDVSVRCQFCQRAHHDSICWKCPNIDPHTIKRSPEKSASPVIAEKPAIADDAVSVVSSCADGGDDPRLKCIFCGTHDYSSNCPNVTDVQHRYIIVERMGLCTNCLFRHSPADRRRCSTKRCRYCNECHNAALCLKNPTVKPSEIVLVKDNTPQPPAQRLATPQHQNQRSTPLPQSTKTPPPLSPPINKPTKLCIFCGEHPHEDECQNVIDYMSRIRIVEVQQRCRSCLEPHAPHPCHDIRPCRHCRLMTHHPYLCSDNPKVRRMSTRTQQPDPVYDKRKDDFNDRFRPPYPGHIDAAYNDPRNGHPDAGHHGRRNDHNNGNHPPSDRRDGHYGGYVSTSDYDQRNDHRDGYYTPPEGPQYGHRDGQHGGYSHQSEAEQYRHQDGRHGQHADRFASPMLTTEQFVRDSSAAITAGANKPPSLLTMPTFNPNTGIPPFF